MLKKFKQFREWLAKVLGVETEDSKLDDSYKK